MNWETASVWERLCRDWSQLVNLSSCFQRQNFESNQFHLSVFHLIWCSVHKVIWLFQTELSCNPECSINCILFGLLSAALSQSRPTNTLLSTSLTLNFNSSAPLRSSHCSRASSTWGQQKLDFQLQSLFRWSVQPNYKEHLSTYLWFNLTLQIVLV